MTDRHKFTSTVIYRMLWHVHVYGNGVLIGADGVRSESREMESRWGDGAKREGERNGKG